MEESEQPLQVQVQAVYNSPIHLYSKATMKKVATPSFSEPALESATQLVVKCSHTFYSLSLFIDGAWARPDSQLSNTENR